MNLSERIKEKFGSKIENWLEHSKNRIYFTLDKAYVREAANFLFKDLGLRLATATASDLPAGFEMIYHYSDDKTGVIYSLRAFIKGKESPEIDSISTVFKAAEWIEREIWELFGINFKNHPDLRHLLLVDDWPENEYPMRKNYKKPHEKKEQDKC